MALTRYVTASCISAQRWVAPALVYLIAIAVTYATGGDALVNLSMGAAWLFPIGAWLTVATLNDEDDDHLAITAAAAGDSARVRRAKLLVASAAGLALASVSIIFAYVQSPFPAGDLAVGIVAHVLTVAGAVALGAVCARPVISRTDRALLTICLITIADLVTPDAPPARLVLTALSNNGQRPWLKLSADATLTLVLASLVLWITSRVARGRT